MVTIWNNYCMDMRKQCLQTIEIELLISQQPMTSSVNGSAYTAIADSSPNAVALGHTRSIDYFVLK